ncbi:oryzalexin E synthase-like [Oryza brachyantha]|uniref:oryzalexin E synthase-like n=1 Tax=Oryza brachyantha TaxID=4533 RepID=UPI001ADCCE66|nr:oryzalexin E synthase-like [Oryza brachyantha]
MEKSEMWLLCAALAVSVIFYLTTVVSRRRDGGRRLPPGPTPLPIVGNLLSLGGIFHQTLAGLARVHGPVMTLKLGLTTAVVVSSRDAARVAYEKHDQRHAARAVPDAFRGNGYTERSVLFSPSSDPQWKHLRGINATHIFSPKSLAAVHAIRERKVREIVAYFRAHAGEEMVFGDVLHNGILNLMSSCFFSVDMADVGSESALGLQHLIEGIVELVSKPNVSDFFPFLRQLDLQGLRRQTGRSLDRAFSILDGIIERRLDDSRDNPAGKQGDFLDALIELFDAGKLQRYHLTYLLFDVFAAGADTMSLTLTWVMAELLHNPSVMAKARAELMDVLGSKEAVEEPDTARLPYLLAVVKEAMRLHPVGPLLLPHCAVEEGMEIDGYAVPRGSSVIFNVWAIMRDPAVWERPDEFVPERFLERSPLLDFRRKEYDFLPFGSGRRRCPGIPLAERVVPFVLASLLREFEWRLPDGMSPEEMDMTERFSSANMLATPLRTVPIIVR